MPPSPESLAARFGLARKRAAPDTAGGRGPKKLRLSGTSSCPSPASSHAESNGGVGAVQESDAQHLAWHQDCAKTCARCKFPVSVYILQFF